MGLPAPTGKVHKINEIEKMHGPAQVEAIKNYAAAAWEVCEKEHLTTAATAYVAAYYTPTLGSLTSADHTADAERKQKKAQSGRS